MPPIDYDNSSTDEPNLNVPIDVKNLNVIRTPPPGYYVREDPPLKRALREAHRIWIAPMVANLPSFLDNWWKRTQTSRRQRERDNLRDVGAAIQGIRDNTLALDPQELFTARLAGAGAVLLVFVAALLIYLWLEQRKRNEVVVFDIGKFNFDRTKVISLVPKKYLIERATP